LNVKELPSLIRGVTSQMTGYAFLSPNRNRS
jgi:hypothetical protein